MRRWWQQITPNATFKWQTWCMQWVSSTREWGVVQKKSVEDAWCNLVVLQWSVSVDMINQDGFIFTHALPCFYLTIIAGYTDLIWSDLMFSVLIAIQKCVYWTLNIRLHFSLTINDCVPAAWKIKGNYNSSVKILILLEWKFQVKSGNITWEQRQPWCQFQVFYVLLAPVATEPSALVECRTAVSISACCSKSLANTVNPQHFSFCIWVTLIFEGRGAHFNINPAKCWLAVVLSLLMNPGIQWF